MTTDTAPTNGTGKKMEKIDFDPWKMKLSELNFVEKTCGIMFTELGDMFERGAIPALVQGALVAVVRYRLGEIPTLVGYDPGEMELGELSEHAQRFVIVPPPANREERRRKPTPRKKANRPEA